MAKNPTELAFSQKYDREHAEAYLKKHSDGFMRRLSNWREQNITRRALKAAGDPGLVLDLPCGAGRFWPLLAENPRRVIFAADNSNDMLNVARDATPAEILARVRLFKASAFATGLADGEVDSVLCIRLLHHIQKPEHRLEILRELHRISRDSVIVSLWVDGNYKAWRRQRLEKKRSILYSVGKNQNRFVVPKAQIEQEFKTAGFHIHSHIDFFPYYAMWRAYILRKEI